MHRVFVLYSQFARSYHYTVAYRAVISYLLRTNGCRGFEEDLSPVLAVGKTTIASVPCLAGKKNDNKARRRWEYFAYSDTAVAYAVMLAVRELFPPGKSTLKCTYKENILLLNTACMG